MFKKKKKKKTRIASNLYQLFLRILSVGDNVYFVLYKWKIRCKKVQC